MVNQARQDKFFFDNVVS